MQNRRNLYRILHVQPDAPAPIIKASYRTIMQTLRQHPDLGGEAEAAQLLNEAVSILCDPVKRVQYDHEWNRSKERRANKPDAQQPLAPLPEARDHVPTESNACLFCKATTPLAGRSAVGLYGNEGFCQRCGGASSPAAEQPAPYDMTTRNEHRAACTAIATLWQQWPLSNPVGVRIVDLSARGAALICSSEVRLEQSILLKSPLINAIARAQYSYPIVGTDQHRVGLALITLKMLSPPGDFLELRA